MERQREHAALERQEQAAFERHDGHRAAEMTIFLFVFWWLAF